MKWVYPPEFDPVLSVRPLVRYVDEVQAVIEVQLLLQPWLPAPSSVAVVCEIEAEIEIRTSQGFHDEHRCRIGLSGNIATVCFTLVHPDRWWPAGMGDQSLYDLVVRLSVEDRTVSEHTTTIGLTSVRKISLDEQTQVLVNGQIFDIQSVIPIDLPDERSLLPVGGDTLLLVRGHYGPDVLYDAADRAGILLIQCVPIHPEATPGIDMAQHVDRLSAHPSLVGWFVGHLGELSDPISQRIRRLDPTRSVLTDPGYLGLNLP